MPNKNAPTEAQLLGIQFNKERKRLKQAIKRATARGYSFPNFVPPHKKTATAAEVQALKDIRGKSFYALATKKPRKTFADKVQPELIKEYSKERQRLTRAMKRAIARGYTFEVFIPVKPKNVTLEDVAALKAVATKDIYNFAVYYDPVTDKVLTGAEGRKLERKKAAKKAAEKRRKAEPDEWFEYEAGSDTPPDLPRDEDNILQYLEELEANWAPNASWSASYEKLKAQDKQIYRNILQGAITNLGRNQVARNAEANAERIKELAYHICYGNSDFKWEDIQADIAAFTAILYGRMLTTSEAKNLQNMIDLAQSHENPQ